MLFIGGSGINIHEWPDYDHMAILGELAIIFRWSRLWARSI